MSNSSPRVLKVIVFLVPWNQLFTFSRVTTRGDFDAIACMPSLPDLFNGAGSLWNGAGEAIKIGIGAAGALAGWKVNQVSGLLEPPAAGSATPKVDAIPDFGASLNNANTNALDPKPAQAPGPGINITKPALNPGEYDSTSPPSLLDFNFNQGSVSPGVNKVQVCDNASAQIVWSANCEHTEDNQITEKILSGMDAGVLASEDPLCAVEGGISFWVLRLTNDQIEELKTEQTQSISAVEANAPIESFGFPISPDLERRHKSRKISPAEKGDRYEKRDTVIKQQSEDVPRLRFISSKKRSNAMSYAYFSPAGAGVTVYVIDSGLNPFNDEFEGVNIKEWIYALGVDPTYSEPIVEFHGSCMASLITGKVYGVSKNVDLIVVKFAPDIGSFLNGLSKVIKDVQQKMKADIKVKGYTVVNITSGLKDIKSTRSSRNEMKKYVKALAKAYGVVVVAASGQDEGNLMYPEVSTWPALFSPTFDIITVGAVRVTDGEDNGQRYEWSSGGKALTVSAPGKGDCASNGPGDMSTTLKGTSVAAATVTGLVAYFLSLPVGDHLRGYNNVPKAVKNYVALQSYPRFGTEMAISNGIDGDSAKTEWNYWRGGPGDFKSKR